MPFISLRLYRHLGPWVATCILSACSAFGAEGPPAAPATPVAPAAPVRPVQDTYFGTTVVDPYRDLEDLKNPQVQAWMKAQADFTRRTLDAIPGRESLLARIHELGNADTRRFGFVRRGGRYFYEAFEPGAQQPKLVWRDGLQGAEHVLLDPSALGRDTSTHFALDYFEPSWDGRFVACGLSTGGSEQSTLQVLEVATGRSLEERIERTSDAVVTWRPDNRSFFYTKYRRPTPDTPANQTEYNARTHLHLLGRNADGEADPAVFGRGVSALDVPEGQATWIVGAARTAWLVAVANHNADPNPSTLYVAPLTRVAGASTPWRKVADVADGISQVAVRGDTLYFLSRKDASRFRILSTPLAHPDVRRARVVVPEGDAVITGFALARDGLYYRQRLGAVSSLVRVGFDGSGARPVPLPFEGNVSAAITDPEQPGALFDLQGWSRSPLLLAHDTATDRTVDTHLYAPSSVDTRSLDSHEVLVTGQDGTRVPLSIIHRQGLVLDGSHPTLLQGYGSYGTVLEPRFWATALAWIERGGVFAVAHVRGGGEYGEDWHRAGMMQTKLNTVFDFIACGQYLVDHNYTSPKKLAGNGASAGGITVGGALTWRPDLFGVILDQVGMSDTLRAETEPNGPPNVSEFGSVKTEAGFHALYAMGAYPHVVPGTAYPAVMFSTGANDPRVAPWHMTKMAARVQAATSSGRPVLLRIDMDAGHGMGSNRSQREVELADLWSFALWQMGEPGFIVGGAGR